MNTLIKFGDLSDKSRWLANGYNYDFNISENDRALLDKLIVIGEGEFTGLASALLLPKMIKEQVPKEHISDWTEILVYMNIIVYEEFRHGMVISKLANGNVDLKEVGDKFIWSVDSTELWNAYGLLVTHCLSEVSNTLLYKALAPKFESEELRLIFSNIQKDESRHLLAWKDLIKDLIDSSEYHKKRVIESLVDGLHKHNAMLGRNYFKGVSDTMSIFPKGSLNIMANIKYNILEYWFGEENPISKRDIKLGYAKFLQKHRIN
ncbi:MAG: hypothetical protein ABGY11_14555 [Candidatus Thioglobus sp.]|jgi:hypothetical protein